jgi:transketolase
MFYDDNHISIEDDTTWRSPTTWPRATSPTAGTRVCRVRRGRVALETAIAAAKAETGKPSLIIVRTIIGWPRDEAEHRRGARLGAR